MGRKKTNEKSPYKPLKDIPGKLMNHTEPSQEPSDGYTNTQLWTGLCVYGLFLLGIYVYTMYPTIMGGDSGELMVAAQELGVAHPPGYPLFTVLSWLAIKIIPADDVAWKCNLLNALFSALAGVVLAATIFRYTVSVGCAIGGSAAWCFCKLTWTWAASAEVFGLNNLFTVTLVYLSAIFQDTPVEEKPKMACLGAFMCGLSLTNQHTLILYVGIIALWVLLELYSEKLLSVQLLVRVGLCFLCGLLPYLYLPLSAYLSNGRWTWGDQRTLEGFLKHFLRQEYGTFDLAKGSTQDGSAAILSKLGSYVWHTVDEFLVASLLLFLLGVKESVNSAKNQNKRSLAVLLTMLVVYLTFFSLRANLDMAAPLLLGVVKRFWLQADCVFILVAAVGASYLERLLRLRFAAGTGKVLLGIGLAICACQLQRNFTECNMRNSTVVEEFGTRILDNVPPNTLIFTKGDLPSNLFRYLHLSRNYRPDVTVFDQEILTYSWSLPMLAHAYPKITFPGERMELQTGYIKKTNMKVFNMKTFLDVNIERFPIIACIGMQDHDLSWSEGYELFPFGPCSWIYKKGNRLDLTAIVNMAINISETWKYPYQGFDETSWDRVATDEMWNAKTNIGLHLYISAVNYDINPKQRSSFLIKAFQIYKSAFDACDPKDIPSYWHKNYALVCEKLLQNEHNYSNLDMARTAATHFQTYLESTPDDKDAVAIKTVIQNLRGQIVEYQREGK